MIVSTWSALIPWLLDVASRAAQDKSTNESEAALKEGAAEIDRQQNAELAALKRGMVELRAGFAALARKVDGLEEALSSEEEDDPDEAKGGLPKVG